MKKRQGMFLAAVCCFACVMAGCTASYVNGTTLPTTTMPTVTTAPTQATVPTEPVSDLTTLASQIPEEIKQEMKQAFIAKFSPDRPQDVEYVTIDRVVAILGDTYVLFVDGPFEYPEVETTDVINGVKFVYGSSQRMYAYHQGTYYGLQEAFDLQIITAEDLLLIAENYCVLYPNS